MFIPISAAILLVLIAILYLLLALGQPLGYLAWGGKHSGTLPKEMRIQSAVSIPAQLFAAFTLLYLGQVFSDNSSLILVIFGYVFMVFFLANTVLNVLSKSKYERFIMTPIAAWILFSFIYVLFIAN